MSKIESKLFVGFFLNPKMNEALKKSASWKNMQVAKNDEDIIQITEANKYYIGIYLKEKTTTFKTLQQTEKELKKMLIKIVPDITTDELHLQIFSKLFVL